MATVTRTSNFLCAFFFVGEAEMMPFERDVTALEEITNRVSSGRSGSAE